MRDKVGHAVFAGRLEIGEDGHAFADAREVVDRQPDARSVRDGEQMEHGVG